MTDFPPIKAKAVAAVLWFKNKKEKTEEILMIKRHPWMRIFPGYSAFPGGKVEPEEVPLEALKREIQEELGVDWNVSKAQYHGVATTPKTNPYRYQTHYYSLECDEDQKILVEKNLKNWQQHPEFAYFEWNTAENFLQQFQRGHLLMVPLVRFFLLEVAHKGMVQAQMIDADTEMLERLYHPLEMQSGIVQLFIPSKTLPPQKFTNCLLINASTEKLSQNWQHVLMVDPSPKDFDEWQKMMKVFDDLKIRPEKILCTHHHIDHCSYLHLTAEHFRVPILMHPKTWDLGQSKNPEIWDKILPFVQRVEHGDKVGFWNDHKLIIHHVPGHAAGQIALTTEERDFFVAGDLFQSEGSVVIGGRGSSMKEYMDSLHKVIQYQPKVLYPSHGIPLGSLQPLLKIMKHRLQRHEEVARLRSKNRHIDEITSILYNDISQNLLKFARENVEAHVNWLNDESLEAVKQKFSVYLD